IDEDNLLAIYAQPFGDGYQDKDFRREIQKEDLRRLRSLHGVVDAVAISEIPLSGAGSATGRKPRDSELETLILPYFVVSDGALETLDVELVAGRDFLPSEFDFDQEAYERGEYAKPVILSQSAADDLFPEGNAVGQVIQSREGDLFNRVIGVIDHMVCAWPTWEYAKRTILLPGHPGDNRDLKYMVRAEPGALDQVFGAVTETIESVDRERVIRVETLEETKLEYFETSLATMKMLTAVIALLIVVTALGIIHGYRPRHGARVHVLALLWTGAICSGAEGRDRLDRCRCVRTLVDRCGRGFGPGASRHLGCAGDRYSNRVTAAREARPAVGAL
ncbi:MAG: ABC transporter permease, partial [Acidobacteriota bacterium]